MGYRDTISKLSFALVFIYLVFDIKLGGAFQYFDSSYFKLLASFVLMFFGLSIKNNSEVGLTPASLISVVMGILGKQFNSEAGYDFYYFSPSKISSRLEFSSIISGVLGLKLLLSTYCVDFSWYIKTISINGISEGVCMLMIFLDFYIYFQIFAKLRLHDFLYQVYHLQNTGGAWTSVYLCQIQSIGYVLSLVIYVIEFLESISQEFLDAAFYSWDSAFSKMQFVFESKQKLQLYLYNIKLVFYDLILKVIKFSNQVIYVIKFYNQNLIMNFSEFILDELIDLNLASSLQLNSSLMSSQISKSRLKSQTYKVQKYCNTNLLDFNFLIIKDLLRSKKVFSNSIKISESFKDSL